MIFNRTHAAIVCALLREGRTNPDWWTSPEREAVTRLHGYRDLDTPQAELWLPEPENDSVTHDSGCNVGDWCWLCENRARSREIGHHKPQVLDVLAFPTDDGNAA